MLCADERLGRRGEGGERRDEGSGRGRREGGEEG